MAKAKGKAVPFWLSVMKEVAKDVIKSEELKDIVFSLVITFPEEQKESGSLSVIIDHGTLTAREGEIPNYGAKLTLTSDVFAKLVTEEITQMGAIQKRMLEIDGEIATLLNLAYLLPYIQESYTKIAAK